MPGGEIDATSPLVLDNFLIGAPSNVEVSGGLGLRLVKIISIVSFLQLCGRVVIASVHYLNRSLLRACLGKGGLGLIGGIGFLMPLLLVPANLLLLLLVLLLLGG